MLNSIANQISAEYAIWIFVGLKIFIVAAVFLPAVSVIAMFSIWWERKVAAHIQSRVGPMHVGGWHGWAQSLADGIKLILKEDLIPRDADSFLFRLAPYLAFAPVFTAFLGLAFGPQLVFEQKLNIGVLYILAVLSIEVMGTILAGWGSASKWSIYGAMREACQMVSYEVPLGLSIICAVLVAGTLNMTELSYLQGGGLSKWFVFHNPFIFCTALIMFIAMLASNKRAPFDLPESESELVAGFHTEYSGLRFSFFFFAEYAGMFILGAIFALLLFGGWNSPIAAFDPVYHAIGYDPITTGQAYFSGNIDAATTWSGKAAAMGLSNIGLVVLNLYCTFWLVIKAMTVVFIQMWLRWTLPRIRIDQVLYCCVKVLLPASLITLVGTAVWIYIVPQPEAVIIGNRTIHRLGHLASDTAGVQLVTQFALTVIGLAIVASVVGVVLWAWLHRSQMPPKTLFPDVMPVGNQQAFTSGSPTNEDDAADLDQTTQATPA